jgi:pimeloyl-ACP methyl ester carboxylesterase
MRIALWIVGVVAALYAAVLAALWFDQEALLFDPVPLPADHQFAFGSDVHETWIDVPGARLNALHLQLPKPDGVVFFLHGNSGNLETWFVNADFYRNANVDMFMVDYRGYGKSSGHIQSEAQLEADVLAAWNTIAPRYAGKRRVIFGRSIGTGLAATLAAQVQPEQTVLVSPYESMLALAGAQYPWVPSAVLRYPLRSDLALPQLHGPVLLAHGEKDTLIPPSNSKRLQGLARHAQLLIVPGAAHNDLQRFDAYLNGVRAAMVGK